MGLLSATVHNVAKLTGNAMTLLLPVIGAMGGFLMNGLLMAISVTFPLRHQRGVARLPRVTAGDHVLLRLRGYFREHPVSLDILLPAPCGVSYWSAGPMSLCRCRCVGGFRSMRD